MQSSAIQLFKKELPQAPGLSDLLNRSINLETISMDSPGIRKPVEELCTWLNQLFALDLELSKIKHMPDARYRCLEAQVQADQILSLYGRCSLAADFGGPNIEFSFPEEFLELMKQKDRSIAQPGEELRTFQEIIGRAICSSQAITEISPEQLINILNDPESAVTQNQTYHLAVLSLLARRACANDLSFQASATVRSLLDFDLDSYIAKIPEMDIEKIKQSATRIVGFGEDPPKEIADIVAAAARTDPAIKDAYYDAFLQGPGANFGLVADIGFQDKLATDFMGDKLTGNMQDLAIKTLFEHARREDLAVDEESFVAKAREIIFNIDDKETEDKPEQRRIKANLIRLCSFLKDDAAYALLDELEKSDDAKHNDETKSRALVLKLKQISQKTEILDELLSTAETQSKAPPLRRAACAALGRVEQITGTNKYDDRVINIALNDPEAIVRREAAAILARKFMDKDKKPEPEITNAIVQILDEDCSADVLSTACFYCFGYGPNLKNYPRDNRFVEILPSLIRLARGLDDDRELDGNSRAQAWHNLDLIEKILVEANQRDCFLHDDLILDFLQFANGTTNLSHASSSLTNLNGMLDDEHSESYRNQYPRFAKFVNNYCVRFAMDHRSMRVDLRDCPEIKPPQDRFSLVTELFL